MMQVSAKHPAIAREGWLYLGLGLILTIVTLLNEKIELAMLPMFFVVVMAVVYRDPERKIPSAPLGIVSPVDGRVEQIGERHCDVSDDTMLCVSIKLNNLGVYSSRSPIEGKIVKQVYRKNHGQPEVWNWVQTDEGDNIIWNVKSQGFGKARCYMQTGERVGQGQRCGFLPFSAVIDLYFPLHSALNVAINDKVVAGESIIAKLVHQTGASIVPDNNI